MPSYAYQRLSAQDEELLRIEGPNTYMHVTGTAVYRSGPLRTAAGGLDVEALRRAVRSVLPRVPRYRQKLRWPARGGSPVWVDDADFNLDYHIRHTALPRPGTLAQLQVKVARIQANHLDRSRPLWEMWVVEGLERDRFAIITKTHHCVFDGSSRTDLAQALHSADPAQPYPDPPPWVPRPAPGDRELVRAEWKRRIGAPAVALRSFRAFREHVEDLGEELRVRARAVGRLLGSYAERLPSTPLTGEVGPRRAVEWFELPLEQLREVRKLLGCSLNDLVLGLVTGAVRDLFLRRHTSPASVDLRVTAPVSVRDDEENGRRSNRVSNWTLRLPIDQADPLAQIRAIRDVTEVLEESRQALAAELMVAAADWTPSFLLSLGTRALALPLPAHLVITNVPGPQRPLYLAGAEMLAVYPLVPLMPHTALGAGVFSYRGRLFFGLNADPDLLPDLLRFRHALESSFEALADAAGVKLAVPVARE